MQSRILASSWFRAAATGEESEVGIRIVTSDLAFNMCGCRSFMPREAGRDMVSEVKA